MEISKLQKLTKDEEQHRMCMLILMKCVPKREKGKAERVSQVKRLLEGIYSQNSTFAYLKGKFGRQMNTFPK